MPIIQTQKRLAQAGRIRAGEQVESRGGKRRPAKLAHWRLTSNSSRNLDAAAAMYGGRVQGWAGAPNEGQYELYTEATELGVVVLPERLGFSQWWELWSGGGLIRRCDGVSVVDLCGGGPCQCDPDVRECRPKTRLSVLLRGLPGVGLWRLDTSGHYAQAELAGAMEMAELLVELRGLSVLPGTLRLDQRSVKRPDPEDRSKTVTYRFAVPVLDFMVDVGALAETPPTPVTENGGGLTSSLEDAGMEGGTVALRPVPQDQTRLSPREQMQQVSLNAAPTKRESAAPTLPPSGIAVRTADEVEQDREDSPELVGPPGGSEAVPEVDPRASARRPQARRGRAQAETQERTEVLTGELCSPEQVKAIQTLFGKSGMLPSGSSATVRRFKLDYCKNIIDRPVKSSKEMTLAEASQVIDALKIVVDEEPPREDGDDF